MRQYKLELAFYLNQLVREFVEKLEKDQIEDYSFEKAFHVGEKVFFHALERQVHSRPLWLFPLAPMEDILGFFTSEKDVHAQNRSLFATWRPKVLCAVGDMFFSTLEFENLLKWGENLASNKHK